MFDPDREPHVARRDTCGELVFGCQLLMRRGGRMDGKRACIADIRDMIEELQRIDEFAASLDPALELEANQRAVTAFEICVCATAELAALRTREDDVRDRTDAC